MKNDTTLFSWKCICGIKITTNDINIPCPLCGKHVKTKKQKQKIKDKEFEKYKEKVRNQKQVKYCQ